MNKALIKYLFFVVGFVFVALYAANAQAAKVKLKAKPPKYITQWGRLKADTVTVYKEEATQLVTLPLKIWDEKNQAKQISSYSILFKHNTVTELEDGDGQPTGKTAPTTTTKIQTFKATPLPALWITILQDEIRKGDEIYIFDIMVKQDNNKVVFAPPMLIKIN